MYLSDDNTCIPMLLYAHTQYVYTSNRFRRYGYIPILPVLHYKRSIHVLLYYYISHYILYIFYSDGSKMWPSGPVGAREGVCAVMTPGRTRSRAHGDYGPFSQDARGRKRWRQLVSFLRAWEAQRGGEGTEEASPRKPVWDAADTLPALLASKP